MKFSIKQKLLFAFISASIFIVLYSIVTMLSDSNLYIGELLFLFVFFGLVFGFGYLYFLEFMNKKLMKKINIELKEDEFLLKEGPAYLMVGKKEENGKLVLTDKRIVYKPHGMNRPASIIEINLNDITNIDSKKTAKIFQNGISISCQNSKDYIFALYNQDQWMELLIDFKDGDR